MNAQAEQLSSNTFDPEQFKQLYHRFDIHTLENLARIYSPNIIFKDPIHELTGLTALRNYFGGFCNPEMTCEFEITNQIIANDQAFFQWTMNYRHPRLQAGKQLTLNGASLIKFNSSIIYHEDFYDMGAMIYQHVPLLGWLVKKINQRIAEPSS